jgi:hypothetical protein
MCSIQPLIPSEFIRCEDRDLMTVFNVCSALVSPLLEELYSEECLYGGEADEDELYNMFQGMIARSQGKLSYVSIETCHTSTGAEAGTLGGSAVFITQTRIKRCSTADWLAERLLDHQGGLP